MYVIRFYYLFEYNDILYKLILHFFRINNNYTKKCRLFTLKKYLNFILFKIITKKHISTIFGMTIYTRSIILYIHQNRILLIFLKYKLS